MIATAKADSTGWVTANAVCTLSMIVWAMGFPAADRLLVDFSPLVVAAGRMSIAAAFLVLLWLLAEGPAALSRARWGRGMMIGGIGFGFGSAAMLVAQRMTDATTVAVISSTLPVVGLALEALFDGRRLGARVIFGVILSLAGGFAALLSGAQGLSLGIGALMAFASVVTFAWGSHATVGSLPDTTPLGRTAVTACGAGVATLLIAALQAVFGQGLPEPGAFTYANLGLFLFSGLISFALSQLLWIVSTERLGIGVAAMHINAAPFYVMVIVYLLGGAWSWTQAAAALVVAVGVLIAQMPGRSGGR